jgi:hypothetical protein
VAERSVCELSGSIDGVVLGEKIVAIDMAIERVDQPSMHAGRKNEACGFVHDRSRVLLPWEGRHVVHVIEFEMRKAGGFAR